MSTETLNKGSVSDPNSVPNQSNLSDRLQALNAASAELNNNRDADPSLIAETRTRVGSGGSATHSCTRLPDNGGTVVETGLVSSPLNPMVGAYTIQAQGMTSGQTRAGGGINYLPTLTTGTQIYMPTNEASVTVTGEVGGVFGPKQVIPTVVDCTGQPQR
jgi:hypothetical protein